MEEETRRLQELGGSLYVSLPSSWVSQFNLSKGSKIFILSEGGELKLFPEEAPQKKEKTSTIIFTKGVFRTLIGEYLFGTDTIRIKKQTPFSNSERKQIQDYVNNLLNFEIIEELSNLITVQNLKSDIPIKKLISRMYYLTKSMLEDLSTSDVETLSGIIERDKLVGKFYFAVIMHTRALLTQRWSKEFSFTELLDLRLLIERIEQIGDEIKVLAQAKINGLKLPSSEIIFLMDKYSQAYNSFVKMNVEVASKFWDTEKKDKTKLTNLTMVRIYDLIKDIADLVV
ncbi:hypothetical protein COV11_03505 [Candidatus Woesearchaeota archaeon CG10_big_fil_rev_8_21_14_0_10_30_7]|nr:MAG: hypothetical protein COV11_03505 [Candidatus Woesearchaeota archaeon CG10_big_fil_rev_8_21_14_0_10_30_7]